MNYQTFEPQLLFAKLFFINQFINLKVRKIILALRKF